MAESTDITLRDQPYAIEPVEPSRDPDSIRRQIGQTREQMADTISEIGERLSPDRLIEQAKTSVKEATVGRIKEMNYQANRKMEGVSSSLAQTVRENPLPAAIVGLGLGWLIMADRSKRDHDRMGEYPYRGSDDYRYYGEPQPQTRRVVNEARERVGEAAEAVQDKAAEMGEQLSHTTHRIGETVSEGAEMVQERAAELGNRIGDVSQRVGERAGQVQERASELATRTRSEAERLSFEARTRAQSGVNQTRQSFWQTMEENPLAVGAVILIAGAAIGAAIPSTMYEDRLMGEQRDRLMDEAKNRTQDVVGRVQTVVEEVQHVAATEARSAAERVNLPLGEKPAGNGGTNSF